MNLEFVAKAGGVFRERFRALLRRWFGLYVYRQPPRGVSFIQDLRLLGSAYMVRDIFDVGANIGQSGLEYGDAFPESRVFCFEPSSSAFEQLHQRFGADERYRLENLALSSSPGIRGFRDEADHSLSRLTGVAGDGEGVRCETLDLYCQHHNIEAISILKIDTEGHDLDVLQGAEALLRAQCIDFVIAEVGLSPFNELHVPFCTLMSELVERSYLPFGVYEQVHQWQSGEPHLRRCNLAFCSSRINSQFALPVWKN